MRLGRLQLEGITRFQSAVEIDFGAFGDGLIAITGPNGAGKTTLLECSGPAALWRELPTRPDPALQNWIGPRGGSLELAFGLGGVEYVSTLRFPARGSPQAFLTADGAPVCSGKLKDYDAAVLARFGPSEAFFTSAFAAQGGHGRFASLSVPDRKAVFRHYLGLDRVDAIHAAAKAKLSRIDLAKIERLSREHEEAERWAAVVLAEIAEAVAKAAEAKAKASEASALLRAVETDLTASIAVNAYRRALSAIVATEQAVERLEGLGAIGLPPRPIDHAAVLLELQAARSAATELARLDSDLRDARRELLAAARKAAEAESRSAGLSLVPCAGLAEFGACKFLAEASCARDQLPSLNAAVMEARTIAESREEAAAKAARIDRVPELEAAYQEAVDSGVACTLAESEIARREADLIAAREVLRRARREAMTLRRELPDPLPDVPSLEAIAEAETAAEEASAALDAAIRCEAGARGTLGEVRKLAARLKAEIDAEGAAAAEGGALGLLVRGFGPGGIQALEIEASGPKVSQLANELLAACYGDRFSLEIRTQRDLKSRAGAAEDFSVYVTDRERARCGPLASLSGGEQIVVDEALRTSLSLFAVESRLGVAFKTLWRDEQSGALDSENKLAYGRMLHRARALGGFGQIVFVSHDDEVTDSADVVVRISPDGAIQVDR